MNTVPENLLELYHELEKTGSADTAWEIVHEYFAIESRAQAAHDLWTLLVGALSSDHLYEAQKGRTRHDLLFFYEISLVLLAAVDTLRLKRIEKLAS